MLKISGLPSPKEAEILELLLNGQERYGLELVKASGGALKRGTIYVTLSRLEEKGFVSSKAEKIDTVSGLPRRRYRITGHGQNALSALCAARAAVYSTMAPAGG
jgi:PadR family transcriptional regulator